MALHQKGNKEIIVHGELRPKFCQQWGFLNCTACLQVFFLSGDRAWPALPSWIKRGPCSLGHLTMFMPYSSMITNHFRKRQKHNIHAFEKDYADNIEFWGRGKITATSLSLPTVLAAKALGT